MNSTNPSRSSLPLVVAWMIIFVAVIGHLPALRGFFAQDDWSFLARGNAATAWDGIPARPLSSLFYWKLTVPVFGIWAPPYHVISLLLAALLAVVTARVAIQLRFGTVGAAVAGLVVAASPVYALAIFWVSATGELLAAVFAMAALSLWLSGGRARWLAATFALASFASKEGAWALPLWIWLIRGRKEKISRGELTALGLLLAASIFFLWNTKRWIPHGPESAYAIGGAMDVVRNLSLLGSWLLHPLPSGPGESASTIAIGAGFWIAWLVVGVILLRRQNSPSNWFVLAGLSWSLLVVVPVVPLRDHLYPYYLTAALPGWALALGALASSSAAARSKQVTTQDRLRASFVIACLVLMGISWTSTRAQLLGRGEDGLPTNPIVRRSFIAAEAKLLIDSMPLRGSRELAVLQATRLEIPEDADMPEGDYVSNTPLFASLDGPRGLGLLVPDGITVRWKAHLDGVARESLVLLDAGTHSFRVLGQPDNARMYSALIAISAGQYDRGRHDLWNVVTQTGTQIRFVYDRESLPIQPQNLEIEAPRFIRHVLETPKNSTRDALLDLFSQLYEAVLGKPLLRATWGETLRADEAGQ